MSRTYRNIKLKIQKFTYISYDGEIRRSYYVDTHTKKRVSICDFKSEQRCYKLYCDDGKTSYKYYRKFSNAEHKTYCKEQLRRELINESYYRGYLSHSKFKGYWD